MKEESSRKKTGRLLVMAVAAAVVSIIVMTLISKDSAKEKQITKSKEGESDTITVVSEESDESENN